jgi:thiosulfate sulfurtransferase
MATSFENITIPDALALLERDIMIADIRDEASYQAGHLDKAVHLIDTNISSFVQQSDFDKPILVYCYHGHSSQHAADFLVKQGFDEVYSLLGGYTAWETTPSENG